MDRWHGKIAVVTGASSGIGAAIAEELAKAGVVVVALARRLNRLQELSASLERTGGKLYPRQCDVTNEEELLGAFEWANAELGGVDILVNNAGASVFKYILDSDVESFRKVMDLNVLATAVSIREAVASMKRRDASGYIININSVAGHSIPTSPVPVNLYGTSKFAVTSLTDIVRKELADDAGNKIKITSVSPGAVKTEIGVASGATEKTDILTGVPILLSKDIADAVLHLLGTREKVHVTELTIRPVGERF